MNSFDDLTPECLGHAGLVYEHVLVRIFIIWVKQNEWKCFFLTCHQSRFKFCTGMNFFQALFPLLLKNSSLLQRSLSYSCHYHYCNILLHKTIYFSQFYAVQYDLTVVFMYFLISLFLSSIQGESKYTFIEELKNPLSVTILIKGELLKIFFYRPTL